MPDGLAAALQVPGLIWLLVAISVAGVVRGFSGFGTGLIFVPVAGQFLPPADLVFLMTLTGLASSSLLVPRVGAGGAQRGGADGGPGVCCGAAGPVAAGSD